MQETVYKCDNDGKIIGGKPHITLNANTGLTGIAVPPNYIIVKNSGKDTVINGASWYVHRICSGFLHFCNPKCLAQYFADMLAEVAGPTKAGKKK